MNADFAPDVSFSGNLSWHQFIHLVLPIGLRLFSTLVPPPTAASRSSTSKRTATKKRKLRRPGVAAHNAIFTTISIVSGLYRTIPSAVVKIICSVERSIAQRRLLHFLDDPESTALGGAQWPLRICILFVTSQATSLRETWMNTIVGRNRLSVAAASLKVLLALLTIPIRSAAAHEALLSSSFVVPSHMPSRNSAISAVALGLIASCIRELAEPALFIVSLRAVLTVLEGTEYWVLRRYLRLSYIQHALDDSREWTAEEAEAEQRRSRWIMIRALVYRMISSVLSTCLVSHPMLAAASCCEARGLRYLQGTLVAASSSSPFSLSRQLGLDLEAMRSLLYDLALQDNAIDPAAVERAERVVVGYTRAGDTLHSFRGAVDLLALRAGLSAPLFSGVQFTVVEVVATQVLGSWFRLLYRLQAAA